MENDLFPLVAGLMAAVCWVGCVVILVAMWCGRGE